MGNLPRLGRTLLIELRLALLEGRRSDAVATMQLLGRLCVMTRSSPQLVWQLIGGSLERQFLHASLALCENADPDDRELEWLERQMEELRRLASPDRWIAREAALAAAGPQPARLPGVLESGVQESINAELVNEERQLALAARRPWPELRQWNLDELDRLQPAWQGNWRSALAPAHSVAAIISAMLLPNFVDSLGREKATQSARALAALALDAGRRRFGPAELEPILARLPPDAWTAGRLAIERDASGAVFIAVAGASQHWEEERWRPPPFRWPLLRTTPATPSTRGAAGT